MEIRLNHISKRYTGPWVFKDLNLHIPQHSKVAVKGLNGSGKSTLIHIIAGAIPPSKGQVIYSYEGNEVSKDLIFKQMAVHSAYTELDEELTPIEVFDHVKIFKPVHISDNQEFMEFCGLTNEANRALKYFSSGMKQRLGLALAINFNTPLLLLDEPGSFLDRQWKNWFQEALINFTSDKTVIIASNDEDDIRSCQQALTL